MDLWEAGRLPELLNEAQRCDKQLSQSLSPMTPEQLERTFNRLMLEGRIRSAVQLLTERGAGGTLDPETEAQGKHGPLGKSVLDVLQEKHPPQRVVDPGAFQECETLPLLTEVDITAAHATLRLSRGVCLEVLALVVLILDNGELSSSVLEQQATVCARL